MFVRFDHHGAEDFLVVRQGELFVRADHDDDVVAARKVGLQQAHRFAQERLARLRRTAVPTRRGTLNPQRLKLSEFGLE